MYAPCHLVSYNISIENEKQELRKWNIHQTVHNELDDTPGQTFVTIFQGQMNAVPTVSKTTVNINYFTLGSYSSSHLYSKAYSFWHSFFFSQICLLGSRRYGSIRANHDCKWYIWYDMHLLTAIGLTPSGSSIVHSYKQTTHRIT